MLKFDSAQSAKLRVVLVEDNADLRELAQELLETLGCSVDLAVDGSEGVARILSCKPDLALVDNGLPVLSCNRVGHEPSPLGTAGIRFWGSSHVLGPQGEFLAEAGQDAPEVLVTEIDLARSEHVRRIWPFLRDRRIDAYQDLLRRYRD